MLDNLIHGYFMLGHPERLDYDYEHIYALVAYRAAKASGKLTSSQRRNAQGRGRRRHAAGAIRAPGPNERTAASQSRRAKKAARSRPSPTNPNGNSRRAQSVQARRRTDRTARHARQAATENGRSSETLDEQDRNGSSLPAVENSSMKTLFLGGGRLLLSAAHAVRLSRDRGRRRRDRPHVTHANFMATGLPSDTTIKTYWGDARQFVELHQDTKKYDLVFGDAFNDFSVPWHLTTLEFNEKIKKMLTPNWRLHDQHHRRLRVRRPGRARRPRRRSRKTRSPTPPSKRKFATRALAKAHRLRRLRRGLGRDRQDDFQPRLHLRDRRTSRDGLARNVRRRRLDASRSI